MAHSRITIITEHSLIKIQIIGAADDLAANLKCRSVEINEDGGSLRYVGIGSISFEISAIKSVALQYIRNYPAKPNIKNPEILSVLFSTNNEVNISCSHGDLQENEIGIFVGGLKRAISLANRSAEIFDTNPCYLPGVCNIDTKNIPSPIINTPQTLSSREDSLDKTRDHIHHYKHCCILL